VIVGAVLLALAAHAPRSAKEQERFLTDAEVVNVAEAPGGVTGVLRATLRFGATAHDASIQTIDETRSQKVVGNMTEIDFRDSYKNNVAAYRLDRMLGLGMIPATVARLYDGKPASYTWWLDDLLMTERDRLEKQESPHDVENWNRQVYVVRLFDQLIYNFDRNLGNLLIDDRWRIWMIDHTRAFKVFDDLRDEKELAETCEKDLLAAMRRLDQKALLKAMQGLLSPNQVDGLLGRRDQIVKHYDELIAQRGADAVLYHLPSRVRGKP
jgi:hypothetical protein